jgi:hypothetical protein
VTSLSKCNPRGSPSDTQPATTIQPELDALLTSEIAGAINPFSYSSFLLNHMLPLGDCHGSL